MKYKLITYKKEWESVSSEKLEIIEKWKKSLEKKNKNPNIIYLIKEVT